MREEVFELDKTGKVISGKRPTSEEMKLLWKKLYKKPYPRVLGHDYVFQRNLMMYRPEWFVFEINKLRGRAFEAET